MKKAHVLYIEVEVEVEVEEEIEDNSRELWLAIASHQLVFNSPNSGYAFAATGSLVNS